MPDQLPSVPAAVPESPLDADHAAFVTTAGVSISVGSSSTDLLPSITRGITAEVAALLAEHAFVPQADAIVAAARELVGTHAYA